MLVAAAKPPASHSEFPANFCNMSQSGASAGGGQSQLSAHHALNAQVADGLNHLLSDVDAAIRIQAVWRGAISRKHTAFGRHQNTVVADMHAVKMMSEAEAAQIIQSMLRGALVRQSLRQQGHTVLSYRTAEERYQLQGRRRTFGTGVYANADQGGARDSIRRLEKILNRAITPEVVQDMVKLQSIFRMAIAKRRFLQLRDQHRAATKIQALFRGSLDRKHLAARERRMTEVRMEQARQELVEKFRQAGEERDNAAALNATLHRKLAEYFYSKRQDDGSAQPGNGRAGGDEGLGGGGFSGDLEQRFQRYLAQYRDLRTEHDKLQQEYHTIAEDMQSKLEDRKAKATEFKQSFVSFKRDVCKSSESSRTGKGLPEKIVRHLEELEGQKDDEVSKARLKNIAFRNRLKVVEAGLKQKEELAEGLHLIDFEQLKIENQTLNEKIEERNEELSKLQKKKTTTVHILTHVKEKLGFVQMENQRLKRQLAEVEQLVTEHRDMLTKLKKERERTKTTNADLRAAMPLVGSDDLLVDYEMRKERVKTVRAMVESLRQRYRDMKNEIARLNAVAEQKQQSLQAQQKPRYHFARA